MKSQSLTSKQSKTQPPGKAKTARKPKIVKPYHHGNLRESLLAAADEVLAAKGAAGLTLRDVARAAGVSHAAPYHHFASLDDLLAAVAARGFDRLSEAMAPTVAVVDTKERLLQISEAYVRSALANPAQFRVMFGPLCARKNEFPEMSAASARAFGMLLAAACAHDAKQGPEIALTGWSLSHGLANLMLVGVIDGLPLADLDVKTMPRRLAERAIAITPKVRRSK
jgi:AcrR family transcriptional regulator